MFKPGTRVVKVAGRKLSDYGASGRPTAHRPPLGTFGTVVEYGYPLFPLRPNEVCVLFDGAQKRVVVMLYMVKPLDDNEPSKLSLQDMLKTPLKETI